MFVLRCKGLDWVRVNHFLDVTGGNKDRGINFEGK